MEKTFIIENPYISKTLSLESGRLVPLKIENKLSGSTVECLPGSEEFEINFKWCLFGKNIKASELKVVSADKKSDEYKDTYIIAFKGIRVRDSVLALRLVYTAVKGKKILSKHLEISYEKRGNKKIILDYIDFEELRFDSSLKFWTVPKQANSHIPGYALEMGQPVYVDSLFMGVDFPATLNKAKEYTTSLRYYNGKGLTDIMKNNSFCSYEAVMGGAEGNAFSQVQKAFFEYIKTISKPIKLRRQYNSWYDHMLNITRENVYGSFLEIEKALTASGEKPLDCYVADDGWNDYNKGFWGFNEKFPDELYPFSGLAKALSSKFGLWVGPRGGYTTDTPKFARRIQKAGNGYFNKSSMDICVASEKYVRGMTQMMLDFQERFELNYWKLDGFAQRPCRSKKHDHMTGGFSHMYFYTDVWEKWLEVFRLLYEKGDSNYWINLTCYAPPSAWFLKYVNSLWMQISDDVGFIGDKNKVGFKDRMLSYRDDKYMDFYNDRQFQFPQRALYNHDPIYGNEAKVEMSDEDFRVYLFTMAMRGTCFWELYYSYNMMNEAKWRINYSALRFIEDNIDVLANSVIFGGRPSKGQVYGFSAFGENEGILCLRNSSDAPQDYTVRLDEHIGVSKNLIYAPVAMIMPYSPDALAGSYSFGDKINVSLAPYETKIMHFGKRKKEMKADYVEAVSENTLRVTFNQSVNINNMVCGGNEIVSSKLLEDYMTVELTFRNSFSEINALTLSEVKDIIGNNFHTDITFDYYNDHIISGGIYGKGAFSIKATLSGEGEKELMKQGDDVSLRIGDDGFVYFTVGSVTLRSASYVGDKVQVMAVREKTGALKLYLDAVLDSGIYGGIYDISRQEPQLYNSGKVVLYNKAFSYDEV